MYKEKLYALLESLEVKNIEELIDGPIENIVNIGLLFTKVAKIGSSFVDEDQIQKMYEDLQK